MSIARAACLASGAGLRGGQVPAVVVVLFVVPVVVAVVVGVGGELARFMESWEPAESGGDVRVLVRPW